MNEGDELPNPYISTLVSVIDFEYTLLCYCCPTEFKKILVISRRGTFNHSSFECATRACGMLAEKIITNYTRLSIYICICVVYNI